MDKTNIFHRAKRVCLAASMVAAAGIFLSPVSCQAKSFKILHIMSYHSPWKWTDDQLAGFKKALNGVDVEYRVFQMDTKRKSSEEWKEKAGKEARDMIDSWKPDLVYTSDDNAQEYVTKYYIGSSIPFVCSGVNADPQEYGFSAAANIAGVLEQEHFVQSVRLLREIVPNVKRIAVITDNEATWPAVIKRMKERSAAQLKDIEFISWDIIVTFKEYKQKIKEYETEADAVCLLGIFTFEDESGKNVPLEEVARWTAQNSMIPEFTFWKDRIHKGHLCAVTVSGYEQGYAAGKIARDILTEGTSPSHYSFTPTVRGEAAVNLARARKLGIKIKSSVLLSAEVITGFEWDE